MPFERISIDPNICPGQACVKGTHLPVHQIVRMVASGDTVEELLVGYPSLTREDILACLDHAAALAEEQVTPIQVTQTGMKILVDVRTSRSSGRNGQEAS